MGSVLSVGTGKYNEKTSRNLNRKLQLSIEPDMVNRGIVSDKVTPGMLLQGLVKSKESKGYMVDLGLKDGATGFIKFSQLSGDNKELHMGKLVQVMVQGVTSKLLKCDLVTQDAEKIKK